MSYMHNMPLMYLCTNVFFVLHAAPFTVKGQIIIRDYWRGARRNLYGNGKTWPGFDLYSMINFLKRIDSGLIIR